MAISFDGETKTISLSAGTNSLSVHDLYSRWKDWVLDSDNSKYAPAFSVVGGDPIDSDAGTSIPLYAFLENGWRIKPQEANHTLNVSDGILLVTGGGDPFKDTNGSFVIRINYQQPVQAIGFSTSGGGGGGATVDEILDEVLTSHTVPNSLADVIKKTKTGVDDMVDDILDEDLTGHSVSGSTADVIKKTKSGVDDNAAFILSK